MRTILTYLFCSLFLLSCSKEKDIVVDIEGCVSFISNINSITRATSDQLFNTVFNTDDAIGVFVVKRVDPLVQAIPLASGNYADNVKLIYQSDGTWAYANTSQTIYFDQNSTVLDFYAYYPYIDAADPTNMTFSVSTGQVASAFSTLELLRGTALNQSSTIVTINFEHVLSLIQVSVNEGDIGSVMDANTAVFITGVSNVVSVNLGTGAQTLSGMPGDISMWRVEQPADPDYLTLFTYRALLPAQPIALSQRLFSFSMGGRSLEYLSQQQTDLTSGAAVLYDVTLNAALASHAYDVGDVYPYKGYPQGVVFSVSNHGINGKIVSLYEPNSAEWATGTLLTGANSVADGLYNMNIIQEIDAWSTDYPAFSEASGIGPGWYLPSTGELTTIQAVRSTLNSTLSGLSQLPIGNVSFWSSTESTDASAQYVSMSTGSIATDSKTTSHRIRAVRTF